VNVKVLFLDIDGVLNSQHWYINRGPIDDPQFLSRDIREFDPTAVARLERVIRLTDTNIVLSSSWRILYTLDEMAVFLGQVSPRFDEEQWRELFIGATPRTNNGFRGDEIAMWLQKTACNVQQWAIVDDDSDFHDYQKPNFVHTSWDLGLLDKEADQLITLLNGV